MTTAPALELVDLNVWYDERGVSRNPRQLHTLKHMDLSVAPGERVGLVGESGSGKSTTILAAMGLLPASATVSGQVLIDGVDIIAAGEASVRPHRWTDIAMVFQGAMSAFNPVKTIGWQIAEAISIHRGTRRDDRAAISRRIAELLDMVGLPAQIADRYPHQLSGGMKQRAVIAMALSCDPKVLLADEPTTALDVVVQDQILKLLVRLSTELNLALVLVTHDLGVVAEACTRAVVMRDGAVVESGTVDDLYHRPASPYTRELFEATPDLYDAARRDPVPVAPTPLLQVTDLRVVYENTGRGDDAVAVDGVSFAVEEGELVALVGQSGCGKTTTAQTILGMQRSTSGSVKIDGTEITGLGARAWRPLRRNVQMIYQDPYEALDSRFRVSTTVEEPLLVHGIGSSRAERRELVAEALTDVGLDPEIFADRYPHELSGGQRQRVAIAASLVLRPRLLLADEPVSMLDVSVRTGVLSLMDRLRHRHRMGILMITHDLSTAAAYADRLAVMHDGSIIEEGSAWQIIHTPRMPYTVSLLNAVPSPDPDRSRYRLAADGV